MRVLNVKTLTFSDFNASQPPKYAMVSHRYSAGTETTFEDVHEQKNLHTAGYGKLMRLVTYIKTQIPPVEWLWMDTCCLRPQNDSEVSEVVNSMFRWLRGAEVCLAYLEDVETADDAAGFKRSAWFRRAWTIQDLLAPAVVIFLSRDCQVIGHKGDPDAGGRRGYFTGPSLNSTIAAITGIPEAVLLRFENSNTLSSKEKLQWIAGRATSRPEDKAYCMVGIFDVYLPMRYGEGEANAWARLLDAIERKEKRRNRSRSIQYAPLADPRSETRILNILGSEEQDANICCSISHISLLDPPEFVALSYHWGDSEVTAPVFVAPMEVTNHENVMISITTNLEAALKELRRKGFLSVWVDKLCINQEDISERSQQVSMMGKIYASAAKVIAWIGLTDAASSATFSFLLPNNPESSSARHEPSKEAVSALDSQNLQSFLGRPYFARMWIIQELAKAHVAELWCGQDIVSLEHFIAHVSASSQMVEVKLSQQALFYAIKLFRERERHSKIGVPRMLLSQALVASRFSIASDPRDNIYAILGLTLDGEDVVTVPDYRRSVEDIFAAASRYMIAGQGLVSLLLLARGAHETGKKSSWMPDWSERTPLPPWIKDSLDRQRETMEFSSCTVNDALSVLGYVVDEVCEDPSQGDLLETDDGSRVVFGGRVLNMRDWSRKFMEDTTYSQTTHYMDEKTSEAQASNTRTKLTSTAEETRLLRFENGVRQMARQGMRLVRLRRRGFRLMHYDTKHGDQVWRLENCPLPVVLRKVSDDHFVFIGEVHADTRDAHWFELVWTDFSVRAEHNAIEVNPLDVAFQQSEARRVSIV